MKCIKSTSIHCCCELIKWTNTAQRDKIYQGGFKKMEIKIPIAIVQLVQITCTISRSQMTLYELSSQCCYVDDRKGYPALTTSREKITSSYTIFHT